MAEILVLDDDPGACDLMERILVGLGHNVHAFTDEHAALQHAKSHSVELAVLDIKLKVMSGLDVLEQIHRDNPEIKAIMLTAYPALAQKAITLGAQEFVVKPVDVEELEAKVQRILGENTSA
jgi:CheY-like chemotaxis protein